MPRQPGNSKDLESFFLGIFNPERLFMGVYNSDRLFLGIYYPEIIFLGIFNNHWFNNTLDLKAEIVALFTENYPSDQHSGANLKRNYLLNFVSNFFTFSSI